MNYRQRVISLFISKTKHSAEEIKSCLPIHNGFTNISYKIQLNNGTIYQVRIANDDKRVNRDVEQKVCRLIKFPYFVYYDVKTGNAIKKWIEGINPSKQVINSITFLKSFAKALQKIHTIKTNALPKHDYFDCFKKAKLPLKHKKAYCELIQPYLNMPLVLSHNDLSADNLIYTPNHQVIFIDYEWARMNNVYWDVANFIREVNLSLGKIKLLCKLMNISNLNALLIFVYLATNYAYQWTFNMPFTKKIKKYRKITLIKLERYYRLIAS